MKTFSLLYASASLLARRGRFVTVCVVVWLVVTGCQAPPKPAAQAPATSVGFAAGAGERGGQDPTGPYEVVTDWPKPLSQVLGHEKWTWGAMQGVFAESQNRVFVLQRGELPKIDRPQEMPYPKVGPSISFPVSQTPFRNASVGLLASPGNQGSDGWNGWKGKLGVDARWEHCVLRSEEHTSEL